MFRKILFLWSSMTSFSFIGYTLTELFRKPDNWRQIYKQTSSTFYTSNDVSRRKNLLVLITELRNSHLITLLKTYRSSHRRCSVKKVFLKISQNSQENTCVRVSFWLNLQVTGNFLWILWNFEEHLLQNTSGGLLLFLDYHSKSAARPPAKI